MTEEEIAREAAERLVEIQSDGAIHRDRVGVLCRYWSEDPAECEAMAEAVRHAFTASILAAIHEARQQSPVPDGIDAERLEDIRLDTQRWKAAFGSNLSCAEKDAIDLLSHIDHLHAVLRSFDGPEQQAYIAGYEAGRKAQ